MAIEWHIEDLVALVRQRYPEWDGFAHQPFVAEEVADKRATIEKARALIGEETLHQMLSRWQYDELIDRLRQLGKDNNLLWNRVPRQGDLAILYRPDLDRAEFGLQMQRLLYGRAASPYRLQQFSDYAARHLLPNKWAFPTYFLFLTHPTAELFVKPQVGRWFLKFLGLGDLYSPYPQEETYAFLCERARDLADALHQFHPRDMVDIQSFLWICARESAGRARLLDVEAQVALGYPATEYDIEQDAHALLESAGEDGDISLPTVSTMLEPHFQAFRLLRGAADVSTLDRLTADILNLSDAQRRLLQDPGRNNQTRLAYRLAWARTRLKNRGLIKNVERGLWQLTETGRDAEYVEDAGQAQQIQRRFGQYTAEGEAPALSEPATDYEVASVPAPYPLAQLATETGYDEETLEGWLEAIERKGQAILYGPPGTGKTFLAQRLARHLVAGGDGFVDLVQFHPAYAYEDFIQGIRPIINEDGHLRYEMVPGRFYKFCQAARNRSGRCAVIIDEINRANLARVFGELMFLLEYRDQSIPLAGGGTFQIPANVRLLGTMNTADRSIALVDHAMRRRFAFIVLHPNYELLRRYHREQKTGFDVEGLITVLERLNSQIADPHYEVGITYFLRRDLAEQIAGVWQLEIVPYLEEYFFDRPDQIDAFRWEKVRPAILGF